MRKVPPYPEHAVQSSIIMRTSMNFPRLVRLSSLALALAVGLQFGVVNADEAKFPDPKVMNFKLPKDFKFKEPGPEGYDQIRLFGDASKPGFYAVLLKWYQH